MINYNYNGGRIILGCLALSIIIFLNGCTRNHISEMSKNQMSPDQNHVHNELEFKKDDLVIGNFDRSVESNPSLPPVKDNIQEMIELHEYKIEKVSDAVCDQEKLSSNKLSNLFSQVDLELLINHSENHIDEYDFNDDDYLNYIDMSNKEEKQHLLDKLQSQLNELDILLRKTELEVLRQVNEWFECEKEIFLRSLEALREEILDEKMLDIRKEYDLKYNDLKIKIIKETTELTIIESDYS